LTIFLAEEIGLAVLRFRKSPSILTIRGCVWPIRFDAWKLNCERFQRSFVDIDHTYAGAAFDERTRYRSRPR